MRFLVRKQASVSVLALLTVAGAVSSAQASGFYVQEQSVAGLGRAFAGQAAAAEDATTIFFNPAGMTKLKDAQFTVGGHVLVPRIDPENQGSTVTVSGVTTPVTGNEGNDVYDPTLIPNLYAAMPITDDLWAGLGISAPFGLTTEYDPTWFGRYNSIKTRLTTIDIAPSVAYRVNDWMSIGGGLNMQYADAELISAVPTVFGDATVDLKGDDFSFGFNAGVLVEPAEGTKVGLHYRSRITHALDGNVSTTLGSTPILPTTSAEAGLNLPDVVGLGISQKITPDLTLLGQVNWTNWDRFKEIKIVTDSSTTVRDQDYKDSWAFAIGAEYALNEALTLRAGYQYDQTPTTDKRRSTLIPDANRNWVSFGLSYTLNENVSFDAGYAHIFFADASIDVTDTIAPGVDARTRMEDVGSIDLFSAALRYRF